MSEITIPIVIAGASLVFTALNYINTHYNENAKIKERIVTLEEWKKIRCEADVKVIANLETAVKDISDKIVRLETKMELFWNSMTDMAADALHKPHKEFAEMDSLWEKWKNRTITVAEIGRLQELLCDFREKKLSNKSNGEIFWASFTIARIQAFLSDAEESMKILTK